MKWAGLWQRGWDCARLRSGLHAGCAEILLRISGDIEARDARTGVCVQTRARCARKGCSARAQMPEPDPHEVGRALAEGVGLPRPVGAMLVCRNPPPDFWLYRERDTRTGVCVQTHARCARKGCSAHAQMPEPDPHEVGRALAEGVGFEPTVTLRHAGFQDRCIRPLCHPSVIAKLVAVGGNFPQSAKICKDSFACFCKFPSPQTWGM